MNLPELRDSARQIWEAALDAANPATCIHNSLKIHNNVLSVGGRELRIDGKLIVIGRVRLPREWRRWLRRCWAPGSPAGWS